MNKQKQVNLKQYSMKYLFLIVGILLSATTYAQDALGEQQDPNSILKKVHKKLNSLKTFQYDITRELNYPSNDYLVILKWTGYYDFSLQQKPIPFRYQIEGSSHKWVYSGTEHLELNKSAKTIEIKEHPRKGYFEYLSFFYNSIITLRNVLPLIIEDKSATKTVTDTSINNQTYKLLKINLGKRGFSNLGSKLKVFKTTRNFIYHLLINPANYLPVEFLRKNDANNDFIKTSFSNFNFNPTPPSADSWHSSNYAGKFKPAKKRAMPKPLSIGSLAPNWKLKKLKGNKELTLNDFKGKVVLIDFWEKNCGYCIESVPYLIKLKKQLKHKNFELLAINAQDSKEKVARYVKRHQINYPVLLNGKGVAKKYYGAVGYPRFFIIDKSGKIVSTHRGFTKASLLEMEKIIKKTL